MAVSTAYSPTTVSWASTNQAIPIAWPFFTGTLVVTEIDSDGVETVKNLTTHYTVSGGTDSDGLPATGTVTMVGSATSGSNIRVTRTTPKTQGSTWTDGDAFGAKTVEAAFDRLTLITQEAAAAVFDGITGDFLQLDSSGEDDVWDAESKIMRDLADGVEDSDAATVGQLNDIVLTAGTGNVVGPASATDENVAVFNLTTGKLLKDGGKSIAAIEAAAAAAALSAVRDGVSSARDTLAEISTLVDTKLGATTGSSVQKANGSGGLTAAAATDLGAGTHAIYMPAAGMKSRTTNGAASGSVETSTNKVMLDTLDFDATTSEGAQFSIRMPASWNEGTITAAFTWSHGSTTTNFGVVWGIRAVAMGDGDAGDAAFGTGQGISDTGGTTNMIYVTSATSAMTVAGTPQAQDWVVFEVYRLPSDGSDTMAIDARLHGVTLYIVTDAITD